MDAQNTNNTANAMKWKYAFFVLLALVVVGVLAFLGGRLTGQVISDTAPEALAPAV